jgi:hypothetical protein
LSRAVTRVCTVEGLVGPEEFLRHFAFLVETVRAIKQRFDSFKKLSPSQRLQICSCCASDSLIVRENAAKRQLYPVPRGLSRLHPFLEGSCILHVNFPGVPGRSFKYRNRLSRKFHMLSIPCLCLTAPSSPTWVRTAKLTKHGTKYSTPN